ncbi:thyrotropin-releasing hormone receptor [Elysia marginata]|uniref:Thyrotropin-releasing hormone receptor n=1 Tax=Elysia marginata TaxID=1093978 RepID=A0AAV4FX61_9GAST|nr:thyrotropin-releasing hormone receptor [Elysia marginata]
MALSERVLELLPCYNRSELDPWNMSIYKEFFHCSFLNINLSTCQPLESVDTQETISALCGAADRMFTVSFWLACALGLLGNGLAILTIASLPLTTATFYVCLLAVSDLLAIMVRGTLQLMLDNTIIVLRNSKTFNMAGLLFDYFASLSNWLLVLICFERFLTIRFPLKKRTCFTIVRAQVIALLLAVALLLIYGIAAWRLGYTEARIFILRNVLYALLPLCLVLATIAMIGCHLWQVHQDREATFSNSSRRSRSTRLGSESSCTCSQNNNLVSGACDTAATLTQVLVNGQSQASVVARKSKTTLQDIARLENNLTVMMLVAAMVFLILTVPHCALLFIYDHYNAMWSSPLSFATFYLLRKITLVMTVFNLSINFILYFLSAKKFRTQLYKVFRPGVWVRRLFDAKCRPTQTPTHVSTQQESLPLDPIANGEPVSLHLLSGSSSHGTIRLKSTGKVQFTLDQSYYD